MAKKKPKRGRPAKRTEDRVKKIAISLTSERLSKVDLRGPNRSAAIGAMIDEAED